MINEAYSTETAELTGSRFISFFVFSWASSPSIINQRLHFAKGSWGIRSRAATFTLGLAILLFLPVAECFGARRERQIDTWRPLNYDVAITFNDQLNEIVNARTEITVNTLKDSVSQIDLDFGALHVDSVKVDNEAAKFEYADELLKVQLPKPISKDTRVVIAVTYHGRPKDGLILTNDRDGAPSAVGDNWPNRVHHWIPSLDHPSAKATVHFTVTAPEGDLVVANGRLDRMVQNAGSTMRTWSYTETVPIPPYCMVIAAGTFAMISPTDASVTPLSYYVPRSERDFAMQGFAPAAPSLKYFTETIAPYPYEKLALIIGATQFGGMENSSAIVFSKDVFDRTPGQTMSQTFHIQQRLVDVVAHEIAHQWFGDSVTESTWSDLWLSEGFATYFAGLVIEKYDGKKAFQDYMKQAAERYFSYEQQRRNPIFDDQTEDLFKLLNPNNYQKGAWVLHMLRSQLGDETFFRGLRAYYASYKNSNATTEDLRLSLEKTSGSDLRGFFKSWVYGSGHPQYELLWNWETDGRLVRLQLRQLQAEAAFPNLVPVYVTTASGRHRVDFKPTSKEVVEELHFDEKPASVEVDPDNTILKEVIVKSAQLAKTRNQPPKSNLAGHVLAQ